MTATTAAQLDELYALATLEQERKLTESESLRYVELYANLRKAGARIDFGVEL